MCHGEVNGATGLINTDNALSLAGDGAQRKFLEIHAEGVSAEECWIFGGGGTVIRVELAL